MGGREDRRGACCLCVCCGKLQLYPPPLSLSLSLHQATGAPSAASANLVSSLNPSMALGRREAEGDRGRLGTVELKTGAISTQYEEEEDEEEEEEEESSDDVSLYVNCQVTLR